jgi:hypothetical protein
MLGALTGIALPEMLQQGRATDMLDHQKTMLRHMQKRLGDAIGPAVHERPDSCHLAPFARCHIALIGLKHAKHRPASVKRSGQDRAFARHDAQHLTHLGARKIGTGGARGVKALLQGQKRLGIRQRGRGWMVVHAATVPQPQRAVNRIAPPRRHGYGAA